jgi:hypothetical protein
MDFLVCYEGLLIMVLQINSSGAFWIAGNAALIQAVVPVALPFENV